MISGMAQVVTIFLLVSQITLSAAQCYNNCNEHGMCNVWAKCECFDGWTGSECSKRICPSGTVAHDIASATDTAHAQGTCSGHGTCDESAGSCTCFDGYYGANCGKSKCMNDCSGKGVCMNLYTAAKEYNGFNLNHTTTYGRWDAMITYGCVCDVGFSGYDCSQKNCDYGNDPRDTIYNNETVTFVCDCTAGTCGGKFRLRFLGLVTTSWLYPTSDRTDLADVLMSTTRKYRDATAYTFSSITAAASPNYPDAGDNLCNDGDVTYTEIKFNRFVGDVPAISIYQDRLTNGGIFFRTDQTLRCDCSEGQCYNKFAIGFDGEITSHIAPTVSSTDDLRVQIAKLKTLQSASVFIGNTTVDTVAVADGATKICESNTVTEVVISLDGPIGNLPRFQLFNSVSSAASTPSSISTADNEQVLTITSNDGRNENVKECNGAGVCNYETGLCQCDHGFEFDADMGPCGRIVVNSSDWHGLARCPGLVSNDQYRTDWSNIKNREFMYVSMNWRDSNYRVDLYDNMSVIERYPYGSPKDNAPYIMDGQGVVVAVLTSNVSAGPLLIDRAKDYVYFVDQNPAAPFIGRFNMTYNASTVDYENWLDLNDVVVGFAMDAHFDRRRIYWTNPGGYGHRDGVIAWASLDASPPVINDISAAIGKVNLVDPGGIAVHIHRQRIFWLDRNISMSPYGSVLRSADLDGGDVMTIYLYRNIENVTMPANVSDVKIDFRNDTVYFIATTPPGAIVKTHINFPEYFKGLDGQFKDYWNISVISSSVPVDIGYPAYLLLDDYQTAEKTATKSTFHIQMETPLYLQIDDFRNALLWTDTSLRRIKYYQFIENKTYSGVSTYTVFGDVWVPKDSKELKLVIEQGYLGDEPKIPVGIVIDTGSNEPEFGEYVECHGNGRCLGLAGNWQCECNEGYYGSCRHRTCPRGPSWFSEPIVDDIAHDEFVECSNAGKCDRDSGACECHSGYEGAACERLVCSKLPNGQCSGNGRCVSMRRLALSHKDPDTLEPDPVVYGSSYYDPDTWDADRIFGCMADEYGYVEDIHNITTYVGPNLEYLQCPVSFDARLSYPLHIGTTNNTVSNETQQLRCDSTGGYFTISFRGVSSGRIYYNASLQEFHDSLVAISTIGTVELFPSPADDTSSTICDGSGSWVNITFTSELGNLPELVPDVTNLSSGTIEVVTIEDGAGELFECSGRGDCDKTTGECKCWPYRTSSDGFGEYQGRRGDCAFNILY